MTFDVRKRRADAIEKTIYFAYLMNKIAYSMLFLHYFLLELNFLVFVKSSRLQWNLCENYYYNLLLLFLLPWEVFPNGSGLLRVEPYCG